MSFNLPGCCTTFSRLDGKKSGPLGDPSGQISDKGGDEHSTAALPRGANFFLE